MSSMMPEGSALRKAIRWISDALQQDPNQKKMALITEASNKFDLSPLETNQLIAFYFQQKDS